MADIPAPASVPAASPAAPSDGARSPFALAMARTFSRRGVLVAAIGVGALALAAIYAPFLAGETALLWRDASGWHAPVLGDLFNRRSYPLRHDLLFNLIAVMLPGLVAGWLLLRRRWSVARRLLVSSVLVVAAWVVCQVPLPLGGAQWSTLWTDRPEPAQTSVALAAMPQADRDAVTALLPPVPHRYDATYPDAVLRPLGSHNRATGARFWLGTDVRGRDVLAQMTFGARISLTIGFFATGLSLLIGTLIGAISGYFGGKVDLLLQRLVEIMMCFPTFILVLVVVAMTSRSIFIIMLVLGLTGWAGTARLVRGEFLAQAVRDYVAAGESLGLSRLRIMFRHILPNAISPLLISATFGIAGAVTAESGLAFLGLGDPTAPSWGGLLEQGRENIRYAWLIYTPGIAVFLLVMSLNVIGNGLREALDPKATS